MLAILAFTQDRLRKGWYSGCSPPGRAIPWQASKPQAHLCSPRRCRPRERGDALLANRTDGELVMMLPPGEFGHLRPRALGRRRIGIDFQHAVDPEDSQTRFGVGSQSDRTKPQDVHDSHHRFQPAHGADPQSHAGDSRAQRL